MIIHDHHIWSSYNSLEALWGTLLDSLVALWDSSGMGGVLEAK